MAHVPTIFHKKVINFHLGLSFRVAFVSVSRRTFNANFVLRAAVAREVLQLRGPSLGLFAFIPRGPGKKFTISIPNWPAKCA